MSMLEVVTMASIIQGEAMYEDEMKKISSVYHNRIKKGMLLQADPTVQYAIPGKNIKLPGITKEDEKDISYWRDRLHREKGPSVV